MAQPFNLLDNARNGKMKEMRPVPVSAIVDSVFASGAEGGEIGGEDGRSNYSLRRHG